MCDTMIAAGKATATGNPIFAKNSDRLPNEAQGLVWVPRGTHSLGDEVQCTYIRIPQAAETHAVLLSQPFWMWGAEIGVNEHGLVIGNEAVFSKIPAVKRPALLGMDLLRLGLERAAAPREAIEVMVELLEEFGQGGNCTHTGELYYHNSFIIANHEDAWVLEAVDKDWVAKQVRDSYSISNCLTIQDEWDLASEPLSGRSFDYAREYSDFIFTNFGKGPARRAKTLGDMQENSGGVSVKTMMDSLRQHESELGPSNNITQVDVCMHAGFGPIRVSQSTASMVVSLDADRPIVFATGTSAPCTSVFKPIWVDAPLPEFEPAPAARYDSESLFWRHERLHRATLLNYQERIAAYAADRDALEDEFIQRAQGLAGASAEERAVFSADCFREACAAEDEWLERVDKIPATRPIGRLLNDRAWMKTNREANIPI